MNPKGTPSSVIVHEPLYRQLKQQLIRSFQEMRSGDRIATEAEYVRQFRVSITTVRQAIRELEAEGWVEKRQGSGTFLLPPSSRQIRHVAVLLDVDITSYNLSPYWLKLTREIQKAVEAIGLSARPYFGDLPLGTLPAGVTCQYLLDDARMNRLQGMIGFFTKRDPSWVKLFEQKNIPFIDYEDDWVDQVRFLTKERFIHSAFRYFKERGCQLISSLGWEWGNRHLRSYVGLLPRLASEYGLRVDPRMLDMTASGWEKGMGWERFRDIWRSGEEKPDALMVVDDGLFADCQQAIGELGISIPPDLQVAVFSSDAVDLASRFPIFNCKLSTAQTAAKYAERLKAMMEGGPLNAAESLPFTEEAPASSDIPETPSSLCTSPSTSLA